MQFLGWMYDLAREQSPREDMLQDMLARSAAAGYNAVGLYLEHRFAYASAPFAAGPGCLTPAVVRRLDATFRQRGLRLIPFLNTLGHMEGFIRAEGGQWLAEGPAGPGGAQICATRPECARFAQDLVADALEAFDDEWVHLGGDETRQLGQCPRCAARVARVGTAGLYADYFGRLCRWVLERGRRPCLWGDMLIEHPGALDAIPRQTVIFDWHYESRPRETTRMFRRRGFDVVCCPAVRSFDAAWCFLAQTQQNIDEHAEDARKLGALGVLVTSWEFSFFSHCADVLPVILAAGRRLSSEPRPLCSEPRPSESGSPAPLCSEPRPSESGSPAPRAGWSAALAAEGGQAYARAAEIVGNRIPAVSPFLRPGTWRQLRDRFVIRQNPFHLWQDWRDEACGTVGDEILRLCDQAQRELPSGNPLHFAIELHRVAVEWVRLVERAYQEYAAGQTAACVTELERGDALLERLRPGLEQAAATGGSTADLARLDRLHEKLERVCQRLRGLAATSFRPAFQTLVHDDYVPGDQAAWRTAGHD